MRIQLRKLAVPILITGWLVYNVWPRPFQVYSLGPIDRNGTHIRLVAPRGWTVESNGVGFNYPSFTLHAPDRPRWWPAFLKRWFPPEDPFANAVAILVFPKRSGFGIGIGGPPRDQITVGKRSAYIAFDIKHISQDTEVLIAYWREDREMRDRTKKIIFDSFRVLPATAAH